ncbi:MAG TPA: gliding motility-associated C-terminal domain-containing protein [Saprospiraceae bacterium]|nr:gliding motility-associated C-terminal domain-containing protein [Saprospiraceae bacterium]
MATGFKIDICYDGSGAFPSYNSSTSTLSIPTSYNFDGSLTILDVVDNANTSCSGVSDGQDMASISLETSPVAGEPLPYVICDASGTADFDLTTLDTEILNGNGGTVHYYTDQNLTNEITNTTSFNSGSTTIYAVIESTPCNSNIVEVDLVVQSGGDDIHVSVSCNPVMYETNCSVCDIDGVAGEDYTIYFLADVPGIYDIDLEYVINGTPQNTTYSNFSAPGVLDVYSINQVSTFTITNVSQVSSDCPGNIIIDGFLVIFYNILPTIDDPGDLSDCTQVTLPPITGANVGNSNSSYFSGMNMTGTEYNAGDVINSSTTLYIYSGVDGCYDEISIDISVGELTIYDIPEDVDTCGSYTLPPIEGQNVGSNASYFTDSNGGGIEFPPGSVLTNSTNSGNNIGLFIFDPSNNCQSNQPYFVVDVALGPSFTVPDFVLSCGSYELNEITGSNLVNPYYSDSIGGLGTLYAMGDIILSDTTIYVYDDGGGCKAQDSIVIEIYNPIDVGHDTVINVCQGYNTPLNLMQLMGGNPEMGGEWLDIDNSGVNLSDSTSVDVSSLEPSLYEFVYKDTSEYCADVMSSLYLTISSTFSAGRDSLYNTCESAANQFNLSNYLNGNTGNGIFINEAGDTILTPYTIDISDTSGVFNYYYIIDNGLNCSADTASIVFSIDMSQNAGADVNSVACQGSIINLQTLLMNNSTVGTFESVDGTVTLAGNEFNSSGYSPGLYSFYHLLPENGSCMADTARIDINLANMVSAGLGDTLKVCKGDIVNLYDGLMNEDSGGRFYVLGNIAPTPNPINTNGISSNLVEYIYVVGDGNSCQEDTAHVYLSISPKPQFVFDSSTEVFCDEDVWDFVIDKGTSGQQSFTFDIFESNNQLSSTIKNISGTSVNGTVKLDPNKPIGYTTDTIFVSKQNTWYRIEISNIMENGCVLDTTITKEMVFATSNNVDLNRDICSGQSIVIGNDTYDENHLMGTTTLVSQFGCDSIITVQLTLSDIASGPDFIESTCDENETFTVGNQTFDMDNPTGDVLLQGAAQGGCDSLIHVEINYLSPQEGDLFLPPTCDQSFSITLSGITFNIDNQEGSVTLVGMASNGCDSIVNVSLDFLDVANSSISETSCNIDYSIMIGSDLYNMDNPVGVTTLSNAASNGCDSIVNVNLSFLPLMVSYDITDAYCEGSNGMITINESSLELPLQLSIDGVPQSSQIITLPFSVELNPGIHTVHLSTDDGCEEEFNVDIEEIDSYFSEIQSTLIGENTYSLNVETNEIPILISWSPTDGLSCTDCLNPMVTTTENTSYTVELTFADGCKITSSIYLDYIQINVLHIPNIFTPNNDGVNDVFYISHFDENLIIKRLAVYDRWGNQVFDITGKPVNDPQYGWDGRYSGKMAEEGVYVYVLELVDPNTGEETLRSGDITLIK